MTIPMTVRIVSACLVACGVAAGSARAQDASATDDVQQGHRLAIIICSNCHVAQRTTTNADSLGTFLANTHRDISHPEGMPNPQLLDFQIKQVSAYLLSLRKQP
jgi:mono/diheme cytochrome c family protein